MSCKCQSNCSHYLEEHGELLVCPHNSKIKTEEYCDVGIEMMKRCENNQSSILYVRIATKYGGIMWPFKKKGISIKSGESKSLFFDIPKDKEIGEMVLNYDDEYGNKYETRAIVNFKEMKIIK